MLIFNLFIFTPGIMLFLLWRSFGPDITGDEAGEDIEPFGPLRQACRKYIEMDSHRVLLLPHTSYYKNDRCIKIWHNHY